MKIALIGYGRMGKEIEKAAQARGHEISVKIDAGDENLFESPEFATSDVAIEFTAPMAAKANVVRSIKAGVPVVSGTTGWNPDSEDVTEVLKEKDGTLMWSSNYSIGVNIFFALNQYLAKIMEDEPQYTPRLSEIHHIHKLDHPSGTAITLAEEIVSSLNRIDSWSETPDGKNVLPVVCEREGEVPGTHIITWESEEDSITIEHRAHSRKGFALGAVKAAEWAHNRKGRLTMAMMMKDIIHV